MRCIFFIAVTSFLSLISTANAEQCNSYIAQKLTLNDPVSLVDKLKNASFEKGEFETTAQYDARIEKAKAEITGDKIIPIDINNKYVVYNADDQQFAVGAWAFPGEITLFRSMSWEDRKGINFGILDRVAVRVSTNEKIMDSYEASNAFGVTATVQKIRTDIISVFERASSYIKDEDLFGVDNRDIKNVLPDDTLQNGVGGRPVMHFSAATSDARNLKTMRKRCDLNYIEGTISSIRRKQDHAYDTRKT